MFLDPAVCDESVAAGGPTALRRSFRNVTLILFIFF